MWVILREDALERIQKVLVEVLDMVTCALARVLLYFWTATTIAPAVAVPSGFPSTGNGLWYTSPGTSWVKDWLPIGNGYLGAMTPGGTIQEQTQLNIESLWSGGPFQNASYNGGNKQTWERSEMATDMARIRQTIFKAGTIDNIEVLSTDPGAYGSYAAAGYIVTSMNLPDEAVTDYTRWLDLDQAVASVVWTQGGQIFNRSSFCSHPLRACMQHLKTSSYPLPALTYAFSTALEAGLPLANVSCFDPSTLLVNGNVANPGMAYEHMFRVTALGNGAKVACNAVGAGNATLSVSNASEAWITWVGGTEYNMDAGDAAHNFTFARPLAEAHQEILALLDAAAKAGTKITDLLSSHTSAYQELLGDFVLNIGQDTDIDISSLTPTDEIKAAYQTDVGDPYLEWLLFNFGRYLLAGSAPGVLPANLQGKLAADTSPPWSADYHSNINIQMNYWFAEMTGMPTTVTRPLFDYIEKTWAPRGAQTATTLYNITKGWVTHNEMNIFGHTGMKLSGNSAQWADYPESAVWMMMHVYDHFSYTQDVAWLRQQGWPLLKAVASFHLDKLISDNHSNDGTLVVAPCNSPEQIPITFGCAHAQQLIWQLFNAVEKAWVASGDNDDAFLQEIRMKRAKMDKGIHIGSWGQLQEWKLDMDDPNDTHRHLSHLIGLYPGYALSAYNATLQGSVSGANGPLYTKDEVLDATRTSLIHRGNGTGPDGDAGWEKVWRAACWAQLGDADKYYHQLTYAIERNYASNLFSIYDPGDVNPIFQIDANLGYPAAVLNALVQAPDVPSYDAPIVINLLPALPAAWGTGSVENAHIREGLILGMKWQEAELVSAILRSGPDTPTRRVQVIVSGRTIEFTIGSNEKHIIQ